MLGHPSVCGGHRKQIPDVGPFPSTSWVYPQLSSALEGLCSLGGWSLSPLVSRFHTYWSTLQQLPVGKIKMGFLDITANMLVFWTLLEGMTARLQALVMKEVLHFPTNATQ